MIRKYTVFLKSGQSFVFHADDDEFTIKLDERRNPTGMEGWTGCTGSKPMYILGSAIEAITVEL